MSVKIQPTVGRVVHFYPRGFLPEGFVMHDRRTPCAAMIAFVHNDVCVNLMVLDIRGKGFPITSVPLVQEGEEPVQETSFCTWMPYQLGQAKKETPPAPTQILETVEQETQRKGLTAPRVTLEQIESKIKREQYYIDGTLTICILDLQNGTKVTGESACVSPENYNEELGKRIARENAVRKIWPLEGYILADHLYVERIFREMAEKRNATPTG